MRWKPARLLLTIGLVITPSLLLAQKYDLWSLLCFDRPIPPDYIKPIRIPVGCEIIDCCPGCPGPGLIEMRIDVAAKALQGAEVRFEGLAPAELRQLRITGNGKLDAERLTVGRGTTTIRGLRSASGRVPFATISLAGAARGVRRPASAGAAGDRDADSTIADAIAVKQLMGVYLVNAFDWRIVWDPCRRHPVGTDRLKAQSIVGGDNTVILMDARLVGPPGPCSDDAVLRSTGTNSFLNVRTPGTCNSEVFIFGANNAMAFDTPVTTWTNNVGDVHTTTLQPAINVPVSIWIADATATVPARAVNDVANANLLYSVNKVGVQFVATYNNISANAAAVALITTNSCGAVAAVQGSAFYTPNTLNVYYVNGPFNGENCARRVPGDGNINYLGTTGNLATLAHEIGHAFGLRPAGNGGHTNDVAGFANNNIMWGAGPATRDHFSLGQAFRMNTHTDAWGGTMLITNGLRPGPGRACDPLTTSNICPALTRDWVRP